MRVADKTSSVGRGPALRTAGKPRKFYQFSPDIRGGGKGHGVRIANKQALITPGLVIFAPPPEKGYGFAKLPEKPHLVHDRKKGKMPRDLERLSGYLLVSERLKRLFETLDPDGFEFVECDFTAADGSEGPQYYLGDVVRVLDAIDEAGSPDLIIEYERDIRNNREVKIYNFAGRSHPVFREDVVGEAHIFRTPYSVQMMCDDTIRDACREAKITGVWITEFHK
jgi:hypothetical protein